MSEDTAALMRAAATMGSHSRGEPLDWPSQRRDLPFKDWRNRIAVIITAYSANRPFKRQPRSPPPPGGQSPEG